VTFGSFNRMDKVNRATIQVWAQVLRAVPDARMLLGNVTGDENKQRVIDWFEHAGVAVERLDLRPRSDMATYLALHSEVDVCLDTLPYGGGTTVYHALWMGVPTVTLAGSTPASRQATCILGHCGLDEFVCDDVERFVRKSILTASSVDVLSTIRAGVRERVLTSPLGQPALVAKGLERALRMMWERWCAELPAQSLDTSPGTEGYK
jgi:predicted O-linked N-acetylglucosamine transferase (SPINDLY family)